MAGLTNQGLEIKRLPEVNQTFRENAVTIFNDLLEAGEVLDTGASSTLGRLIGVVAPSEVDLWEALQELYLAFDPNSASGIALDNLVVLSGIVRQPAAPTIALLDFFGDYGVTISAGSQVSSSFTGKRFNLNSQVVFDETSATSVSLKLLNVTGNTSYGVTITDGVNIFSASFTSSATPTESSILSGLSSAINNSMGSQVTATVDTINSAVLIESNEYPKPYSYTISSDLYYFKAGKSTQVVCTEVGPVQQAIGTIDTILTPVFGWDSIDQKVAATTGSSKETDEELRERFNQSKFTRGSNLPESLFSKLISLVGVEEVIIYENPEDSADGRGIPSHSYMVIVNGGLDSEIGQTIWDNKPIGISPVGNTSVDVTDFSGNTKEVQLQRPTFIPLYVSVDISTFNNFPTDGVDQIKTAIFEYANNISEISPRIVPSRFYGAVNSVEGHEVNSILVGTSAGTVGADSFSLSFDEIASININDIEVQVT